MKFECDLANCTPDFRNGGYLIVLHTDKDIRDTIDTLKQKNLDAEIKRHTESRSLNANAYFHKLVGEIADVMKTSKAFQKNLMITTYGQYEYLNGDIYTITSPAEPEQMLELEFIHSRCVGTTWVAIERDGDVIREPQNIYQIYRGSSTYNKEEMSQLIEGTVQEAKALGIDTKTPDEQRKMLALWEAQYGKETL